MNQANFESKLIQAVRKLYANDAFLLKEVLSINERTVMHKLACYLSPIFPNYNVDCEYNRMQFKNGSLTEGDFWKKTLNLEITGVTDEDNEAKTVYPDIVIHKRGTNKNLAIIEIKLKWKNRKKADDYKKLKQYKIFFNYEHAIYLELGEVIEDVFIDYT